MPAFHRLALSSDRVREGLDATRQEKRDQLGTFFAGLVACCGRWSPGIGGNLGDSSACAMQASATVSACVKLPDIPALCCHHCAAIVGDSDGGLG